MGKGFYLPKRISKKVVDVTKNAIESNSLNLGLFLNKYVLWYTENEKMNADPTVQISFLRKAEKSPQEVKKLLYSNISGKMFKGKMVKNEKLNVLFKILPCKHYESYRQRMENFFKDLEQMGYSIVHKESSLNWRLIINFGSASVYETSLLIHRNYSIPYIPGSGIKGVTRHWAIRKFAEKYQQLRNIDYEKAVEEVDKALENGENLKIKVNGLAFEDAIKIFGTQKQKGRVIFFDALPVIEEDKDFIVLDVMNVHYRDYYKDESEHTPPGDWMDPNPVFFLAVEKGTKFKFTVASQESNLANQAMDLLKEAINKIGIGAKTSAGYGYFKV